MYCEGERAIEAESANDILVVLEPDENVRDALSTLLRGRGWNVEIAEDANSLGRLFETMDVTAVVSEASLPTCTAADILQACARLHIPVIFTGHDLLAQEAVDLIRQGAHDYLEKPFKQERLLDLLKHLSTRQNVRGSNPN